MATSTAQARLGWWALLAPAFLLLTVLYLVPILQVLAISVTDPHPGLGNYQRLFSSSAVQRPLFTTLRICVLTTAISLFLGYALAYLVALARPQAQRWWLLGLLIPMWLSVLVRAFAWLTLLRRQGLINEGLQAVGVTDAPLPLIYNEFGITVGMVHYMVPYAVLPLLAAMRDIDPRLLAAARGLGASRLTVFRRIFLPLSAPGLIASGLLVFIFTLGFYITPALLGGGRTVMAAEWVKLQILDYIRWGMGTMMAAVLVITVLVLLGIFSRVIDLRRLFGGAGA